MSGKSVQNRVLPGAGSASNPRLMGAERVLLKSRLAFAFRLPPASFNVFLSCSFSSAISNMRGNGRETGAVCI
jgi:hypothetical protein